MNQDYARIEAAIRFIRDHLDAQPPLDAIAAHVGLSPHHFHRLFRRWAGVSPKRYLEHLTVERAKGLLDQSHSVLDVALALGLSGPSRLHEQFVVVEGISPGEYRRNGRDVEICYGTAPGPFGDMLIAQTGRGICFLAFVNERSGPRERRRLQRLYGLARLAEDTAAARRAAAALFLRPGQARTMPIHLCVRGTNFQLSVWRALLRIPPGETLSYGELAGGIGRAGAARAVAGAVAANPVNCLIPCHRVLRADGSIGGYRGGAELKRRLLDREAALRPVAPDRSGEPGARPPRRS